MSFRPEKEDVYFTLMQAAMWSCDHSTMETILATEEGDRALRETLGCRTTNLHCAIRHRKLWIVDKLLETEEGRNMIALGSSDYDYSTALHEAARKDVNSGKVTLPLGIFCT